MVKLFSNKIDHSFVCCEQERYVLKRILITYTLFYKANIKGKYLSTEPGELY